MTLWEQPRSRSRKAHRCPTLARKNKTRQFHDSAKKTQHGATQARLRRECTTGSDYEEKKPPSRKPGGRIRGDDQHPLGSNLVLAFAVFALSRLHLEAHLL